MSETVVISVASHEVLCTCLTHFATTLYITSLFFPRLAYQVKRTVSGPTAYPDGRKLIAGMPRRMRLVIDKEGANIGK